MLALKARRALRDRYESLDPFALKDELETRLKQILKPKTQRSDLDVIPPAPPKDKPPVFDRRGARA